MKIALYRHTVGTTISYEAIHAERDSKYVDAVRISDWVEVDFPPRAADEFVPEQLAMIDKAETELRQKFAQKLEELAEQRAKLRCITHDVHPSYECPYCGKGMPSADAKCCGETHGQLHS